MAHVFQDASVRTPGKESSVGSPRALSLLFFNKHMELLLQLHVTRLQALKPIQQNSVQTRCWLSTIHGDGGDCRWYFFEGGSNAGMVSCCRWELERGQGEGWTKSPDKLKSKLLNLFCELRDKRCLPRVILLELLVETRSYDWFKFLFSLVLKMQPVFCCLISVFVLFQFGLYFGVPIL